LATAGEFTPSRPSIDLTHEYVLDTSVLRGTAAATLKAIARANALLISPLSILELFCHLDEVTIRRPTVEGAFRYMKATLLKCEGATILGDPFAEAAEAVGATPINPTAFVRMVFPQILAALRDSDSLPEFYAATVRHPSGERSRCADLAAAARRMLATQEAQWTVFVRRVRNELASKWSFLDQSSRVTADFPRVLFNYVSGTALGFAEVYPKAGGRTNVGQQFYSIGLWLGYTVARIKKYEEARAPGGDLLIDENDFEDAAIVRHIELDGARTLVTADKGTLDAIQTAIGALNLAASQYGLSLTWTAPVMTPAQLVARSTSSEVR
jgi:hypothetical protein